MSRIVVIQLMVKDTKKEDVSDVTLMPFDSPKDQDLFSSYIAGICTKLIEAYPDRMTVGKLKKDLFKMIVNPDLLN